MDIIDKVCSSNELKERGLRPIKPAKGEAQWQLVHFNTTVFKAQDTNYRGYQLLKHPSTQDDTYIPHRMEPSHDLLVSDTLPKLVPPLW